MSYTEEDQQQWAKGRLIARMWYCGDEFCDCTEPIVERIEPNLKAGFPWVHRTIIWRGDFHSQADHVDWLAQWRELLVAAKEHSAELEGEPPEEIARVE